MQVRHAGPELHLPGHVHTHHSAGAHVPRPVSARPPCTTLGGLGRGGRAAGKDTAQGGGQPQGNGLDALGGVTGMDPAEDTGPLRKQQVWGALSRQMGGRSGAAGNCRQGPPTARAMAPAGESWILGPAPAGGVWSGGQGAFGSQHLGGGPRHSLGQRRGAVFCLGRPGCEPCCGPQLLVRPVWPWGRHQAGEMHPPAVEASLDPKTLWRPLRIRPLCSQLFKTGQVIPQVTLEAQPDIEGAGVRVKLARNGGGDSPLR